MPLVSGRMGNPWRRNRPKTGLGLVGLLLVVTLALGACTEPIDQRAVQPGEVATDVAPTNLGEPTETHLASGASPGTPKSVASPTASSVTAQPAPNRIYFTQGGDLWQIPVDTGNPAPVLTGRSILAFAPAPDGEQVAVIYLSTDSNQEHLADYKADGTSVIDVALAVPPDDQSSRGGDVQSIAWSPSGDRVALARQDGSISVVTNDGTISEIVKSDTRHFPGALSVSPNGQTLLYLDPALPGRATSLYTIPMGGGDARKLADGSSLAHAVLAAKWLPNSSRIAYLQGVASSPAGTGDVFSIDSGGAESDLLVPSAEFAPVAGVGDMAFSGNGHWVAFTLYGPANSDSGFQGLWLMNLDSHATEQIPIDTDQAVTDLWWGNDTLLYRTVKEDGSSEPERYTGVEPFSLYSVKPAGDQPLLRHKVP